MTANNSTASIARDAEPTCDQSWSLARLPGWAPSSDWIQLGVEPVQIENGVYQIEGCDLQYDPELPPGCIEFYDHPERGQSFWDDNAEDGSDFAGHVSAFYLGQCRIRRVLPNNQLRNAGGGDASQAL